MRTPGEVSPRQNVNRSFTARVNGFLLAYTKILKSKVSYRHVLVLLLLQHDDIRVECSYSYGNSRVERE